MSTDLPISVNKDLDRHLRRRRTQPSRGRSNVEDVACTA